MKLVSKQEVQDWIKDIIWVAYAFESKPLKKLYVALGFEGYRVTHGREIIYEGYCLDTAIKEYNAITAAPNPEDAPKTDN
jgi:hypothetical protein